MIYERFSSRDNPQISKREKHQNKLSEDLLRIQLNVLENHLLMTSPGPDIKIMVGFELDPPELKKLRSIART